MPNVIPNLWFDTQAVEAAEFYCAIFPDSRVLSVTPYPDAGPREPGTPMLVEFELDGQRFMGLNGGPEFVFNEAVSFQVDCTDQEEVDYYWERLTDGGEESQCGWLKDRYGVSWQVVPRGMEAVFGQDDPERAARAMTAMQGMKKLDIEALRRAAEGPAA